MEILSFIERVGVKPQEVISSHPQTMKLIKDCETSLPPEPHVVPTNHPFQSMPVVDSTIAGGQSPSTVSTMREQQSPTAALTLASAPEAMATDADITNSVIVDTTADRIVMIESEPDEEQSLGKAESVAGAPAPTESGKATLHLRQNLRSGQAISCPGNLVLIGDVNAGAEVTAGGDITVWALCAALRTPVWEAIAKPRFAPSNSTRSRLESATPSLVRPTIP